MEKISADELEYMNTLLMKLQEVISAKRMWEEHLARKYKLSANDTISNQGEINRAEQPAAAPPQQPPQAQPSKGNKNGEVLDQLVYN